MLPTSNTITLVHGHTPMQVSMDPNLESQPTHLDHACHQQIQAACWRSCPPAVALSNITDPSSDSPSLEMSYPFPCSLGMSFHYPCGLWPMQHQRRRTAAPLHTILCPVPESQPTNLDHACGQQIQAAWWRSCQLLLCFISSDLRPVLLVVQELASEHLQDTQR